MSFGNQKPMDEVQYAVELPIAGDATTTQLVLATDYEDAVAIQNRYKNENGEVPPMKTRRILITEWLTV